jgi:Carboxypeptidase regulatory-like domain
MRSAILLAIAALAFAQDENASLKGVVQDSVSHGPVKKAEVMLNITSSANTRPQPGGAQQRGFEPKSTTTDANGTFAFTGLIPGTYELRVSHPRYPAPRNGQPQRKVEVRSGEEASGATIELVPGASISGRVLDEDGDPIPGCFPQARSAKGDQQGVQMLGEDASNDDGEYRVYGLGAGKYVIAIQCGHEVFQPRALSPGPPPPPSFAYSPQFYPLSADRKAAEVIELTPGLEKTGVDFRLAPSRVFPVHGRLAIAGVMRKLENVNVMLVPQDRGQRSFFGSRGPSLDLEKGTFEMSAPPGAYTLAAFSYRMSDEDSQKQYGARRMIQVTDRPVEVDLELQPAIDLTGTIEVEGERKGQPETFQVSLMPMEEAGGGAGQAQTLPDGSFTIKSVLPGIWKVQVWTQNGFVKSIWAGSRELPDRILDTSSGGVGPLRVLVSTKTGTIHGTGPAGRFVAVAESAENEQFANRHGAMIDNNGEFFVQGLAPGKYRVSLADQASPEAWSEEGREVTVAEGETVSVELTGAK